MEYKKGYVYELMDRGGPTDVRESYFKEAVEEMMRLYPMIHRMCSIWKNYLIVNWMMYES